MGWWIVLWILLAAVALIALLFMLPVGVRICYRQEDLKLWIVAGPIRVPISLKTRDTKKKKKDSSGNLRKILDEPLKKKRKFDNALGEFLAAAEAILGLFWDLRPKLRIKRLELKLHLAGKDPASLAWQYGGAWAAIGGLLPILEEGFVLKKRELDVDCDFTGEKTWLDAKMDISIGLGRLICCLVRHGIAFYKLTDNEHIERR